MSDSSPLPSPKPNGGSVRSMATGLPPVSFREVNGRQKALVTSVMERCQTLKVRFERDLEDFKTDDSADKVSY